MSLRLAKEQQERAAARQEVATLVRTGRGIMVEASACVESKLAKPSLF